MKNIILIILVIIIGFLFTVNKTLTTKNKTLLEKNTKLTGMTREATVEEKAKCFKDGNAFYEPKLKKEKESYEKADINYHYTLLGKPTMAFNTRFNTCLIAWEDMNMFRLGDRTEFYYLENITDVYTNKNLYTRSRTSKLYNNKKEENTESAKQEEYWSKLNEYGL